MDLRAVDCDILTLGQYLRPSAEHLPVERYYHPDEFAEMREEALALGFRHVESGPLVRSSYHARDQVPGAEARRAARLVGAAGASPAASVAAGASSTTSVAAGALPTAGVTSGAALAVVDGTAHRAPTIAADGRVIYRPD